MVHDLKSVTVEEVARECGPSRATVSRVIDGASRVRPATVERVQRAIAKLGYHPNDHARALSGDRSGTVAVLLRATWRPYYSTLPEGVDEVASREGLHVLLRSRDYLTEAPRLVEEGRADGFIVRNMDEPEARRRLVGKLTGRNVPFILVGNPLGDCQSITIDNVGGARAPAHHFAQHTFRRTLFIAGPDRNVDSTDRLYGFKMGLGELGVTAMETLTHLLAGAPAHLRHVIPPTTLVVRASRGCRYAEHNPPIPDDRLVLS